MKKQVSGKMRSWRVSGLAEPQALGHGIRTSKATILSGLDVLIWNTHAWTVPGQLDENALSVSHHKRRMPGRGQGPHPRFDVQGPGDIKKEI